MRRVHIPPLWGVIKGMYSETNTLPKQHTSPFRARLLIVAGSVFAGGGQAAQPGSSPAAQQKLTIKVGDNWGAAHPMAAALDTVFKPQIEQASGAPWVSLCLDFVYITLYC